LTAAASSGEPSWNFTPGRRWKVYTEASGDEVHFVASAGISLAFASSMSTSGSNTLRWMSNSSNSVPNAGSRWSGSWELTNTNVTGAFAQAVGAAWAAGASSVVPASPGRLAAPTAPAPKPFSSERRL
jgi:hypothetical protein